LVPESGEPFDMKKFGRGLYPRVDANRLKKKKIGIAVDVKKICRTSISRVLQPKRGKELNFS